MCQQQPPHPAPHPLVYRPCRLRTCVCQATRPLPGNGERKSLSPDGDALSLPQTAFSDFLMGSSKDLAKHIRVVVSGPSWQAEWVGPVGREAQWEGRPPWRGYIPSTHLCSCLQCDGTDLTPKIQDLKPQCIVFLNIPR